MTPRGQKISGYFSNHRKDFLSLLKALVEQETPSDHPESFDGIFHILRNEFEELGFIATHVHGKETAGHLLIKPPKYNPDTATQFIVGHCDTVWPLGTLKEMPFSIEGNTVSGPGIYDMKTGLCMMISALRAIQALNKKLQVQPVFLISSDEEIGSVESKPLLLEWAKLAGRTFVLEPSLGAEGKIKTRRKGVGEFEIIITGKPSHAGLAPEQGVSAILALSQVVQQLFQLNDPSSGVSVNVGTIEGGERSNVVAAKSKALVDVRVLSREGGRKITEQLHNMDSGIDGIDIQINGDINRPPMEKTAANEELWQHVLSVAAELDLTLKEGVSGGASDGNLTNPYSPTLDGLGAVGEGAHAWHEKIFLSETLTRAALFTLLLLKPDLHLVDD